MKPQQVGHRFVAGLSSGAATLPAQSRGETDATRFARAEFARVELVGHIVEVGLIVDSGAGSVRGARQLPLPRLPDLGATRDKEGGGFTLEFS